jgi:hypothetical protein
VASDFIINDETAGDDLYPAAFGRGHDPSQVVPCMFAPPAEIPLVPESEWVPRIRDRKKYKTGLRDLYDAGRAGPTRWCGRASTSGPRWGWSTPRCRRTPWRAR